MQEKLEKVLFCVKQSVQNNSYAELFKSNSDLYPLFSEKWGWR
jgi:hypothetical protein